MSEENKNLGDMADDAMDNANKKANNLGDKANDSFEKGKEKAKDFGDKAEDAFDTTKEKASEFAHDAKEKVGDFAEEAKEKASEFTEGAKKTANEFSENAKEAFSNVNGENKKMMAGILAIVLGSLGIHKFVLGYQKEGIIMLVTTLVIGFFTCGIGASIMGIIGLIEGIIYLTKSDEEFYNTYQVGQKTWF